VYWGSHGVHSGRWSRQSISIGIKSRDVAVVQSKKTWLQSAKQLLREHPNRSSHANDI
jgi:hypothetical protein